MQNTGAWGLTLLRAAVGTIFLMHGGQKLFVYGFEGVAKGFAATGIPLAPVAALVVSLVEFLGGLLLLLGLFTRWAALLLAAVMAVALVKVHLPQGFFLPRGFEFVLILLCACLALALTGPGAAALERYRRRR